MQPIHYPISNRVILHFLVVQPVINLHANFEVSRFNEESGILANENVLEFFS